ncbi:MAG: hypothetical protein H6Q67_2032 [Firmicutes bacterium]|nr:hypothetical protein [Bacillota bacterium]
MELPLFAGRIFRLHKEMTLYIVELEVVLDWRENMKLRKKISMVVFLLVLLLGTSIVQAKTILYVPQDDRPVSLEYVENTAKAAHINILVPPEEIIASRDKKGSPEKLWQWVIENGGQADAMVLSGDSLIYGGLVDSRTHSFDETVLQERVKRFCELHKKFPEVGLYVYSTVLRTPQGSSGGVEPDYYEKYGWNIFQLTALRDKKETVGLTRQEQEILDADLAAVPSADLEDWMKRRQKNFAVNADLIDMDRQGVFRFFLLGRDDTSPYSQSHKEGREFVKLAADLSADTFQTFPGADQLGMVMLVRAYNDLTMQIPIVQVQYALGAGSDSVPSYEDQKIGKTIVDHITAAGGIVFAHPVNPDLVIAVNTPETGKTLEAESSKNTTVLTPRISKFVDDVEDQLIAGKKVTIADVSFANGSDNALMAELARRHLLDKLSSYSGWNTASNTLGYAIGQGMLSGAMSEKNRKRLLAIRYLDDWAYEANIRRELDEQIVYPDNGSIVYLNDMKPILTAEAQKEERLFAEKNLWFRPEKIKVSFPWNRMFELKVEI